ncbi:MAG: chitobiase/beta-hexosaminidase C-terminal domain-containing protein, partial [Muribaculaceae bacterium]|nr:chitobiase/beta-hexosaminidase C-terminal domain-containing protein [Muribaculaceae bacterium]
FGAANQANNADAECPGFIIPGTYNGGGTSNVSVYGSDKGTKVRTNRSSVDGTMANTLEFTVKEYTTITALEVGIVTNDASNSLTLKAVYVDGNVVENIGTPIVLPNTGNATGATIINLTGITAKNKIWFEFDPTGYGGKNQQAFIAGKVTYEVLQLKQLATPEITFNEISGEVTITPVANATKIVYTTDGTKPTSQSTEYTVPFNVTDGTVVNAMAIGDGETYSNSPVSEVTVLLKGQTVDAPTISQFNGTFVLSTTTDLATCEYSLDGGNTWIEYTIPVTLFEKKTIKARASREGATTSDVVEFEITALPALAVNTKTVYLGAGAFDIEKATDNKGGVLKGIAGSEAEGYSIEIMTANKGWGKDDKNLIAITKGVERTPVYGSNGAQNTIYLPEGVKAYRVIFYSYMPTIGRASGWNEVNGKSFDYYKDITFLSQDPANPDIRVFDLGEEGVTGSFTFAQTGERPNFVMALEIEDPEAQNDYKLLYVADGKTVKEVTKSGVIGTEITLSDEDKAEFTLTEGDAATKYTYVSDDSDGKTIKEDEVTVVTINMKGTAAKEPNVLYSWDFTDWSEATVANLMAKTNWSDIESASSSEPTEISKDNCFWQVSAKDVNENKYVIANGKVIEELEGLVYTNTNDRSLAIALNYPEADTKKDFGPYHGPAYLWLGSNKKNYFIIPGVPAGATIKMGVESHKITDPRGVELSIAGEKLNAPNGSAVEVPTTYTEQEWYVPATAAASNDVQIYNTNGCHIYYITVTHPDLQKYTLKYVAGNDTIKKVTKTGTPNSAVSLTEEDTADFTITENGFSTTYTYVSNDSEGKKIAEDGSTEVTITMSKGLTVPTGWMAIPGVLDIAHSSWKYDGLRLEEKNGLKNIGYVKNNTSATGEVYVTEPGVYSMTIDICDFYLANEIQVEITDQATGNKEVDTYYHISEKGEPNFLLEGELTEGKKSM